MALMLGALHKALITAGADGESARKAAEEVYEHHRQRSAGPWPPLFVVLLGALTTVTIVGIGMLFARPSGLADRAACDRIFAEFMTTNDLATINRNGWLLDGLNCNVSRRYRRLTQ